MRPETLRRFKSWEGMLFAILLVVIVYSSIETPGYLTVQNQVNLMQLGIEKAIITLAMAFVIICGEIDLSVASVMGLSAVVVAVMANNGYPVEVAVVVALITGVVCGLINGFLVAVVGLPALVATLAGLIGYRGLAYILIEDKSVGGFPDWFNAAGQSSFIGPLTLGIVVWIVLAVGAVVLLHRMGYGRRVYVVGNSKDVARFSGVRVRRVKFSIFVMSALAAALAGLLYAARLGAVRGSTGFGFELDIITVVLLGGVSVFGGSGTMVGVILSTLLVLQLRNALTLIDITGNMQAGIVGLLLILSVLVPNLVGDVRERLRRRQYERAATGPPPAARSEGSLPG
ncbi:MAG: ABC transporter permease [Chloroflexota bacterium]